MSRFNNQFRKRPVVIEAVQFNGFENEDQDTPAPMFDGSFHGPDWIVDGLAKAEGEEGAIFSDGTDLIIVTLEGDHIARPGDWIIKGVQGEIYPCKPDIFAATYDEGGEQLVGNGKNPKYRGDDMTFVQALDALKEGLRVARSGWNGKGMFAYLVPPASYPVQTGAAKSHFGEGSMVPYNAYLALKGVDETVSTWVPSVTDCLAEDWTVIA